MVNTPNNSIENARPRISRSICIERKVSDEERKIHLPKWMISLMASLSNANLFWV